MGLVKLKSADSKFFEVDRSVLKNFKMIEEMLECIGLDESNIDVIPLKQIDSTILEIILKWAESHQRRQQSNELFEQRDELGSQFMDEYGEIIYEIINAANFLGAEELSKILIQKIAKNLANKSLNEAHDFAGVSAKKSKFQ